MRARRPAAGTLRLAAASLAALAAACGGGTGLAEPDRGADAAAPAPLTAQGLAAAALPPEPPDLPAATPYRPRPPLGITFARDIAPIVFENCTPCHRQGQAAPFPFTSYREVKKHARQVATVTASRFMPPWLPARGYGAFLDERGLTDDEIGRIQQWVREGAIEGDPADLPALPQFASGWRLGPPDLEVSLEEPYVLEAGGKDVFRNFVIRDPVPRTRYVRGVEFRPNSPRLIHHAEFMIDETDSSADQDAREEGPGYGGMHLEGAHGPPGHFIGWVPGRTPFLDPGGMSWALERGTDLVLQLHMLPSGKREAVLPAVGLFFTDEPPRHEPLVVRIGSRDLDIPAGEKAYVIRDTLPLPVDVQVLSVVPHAHYLGKEIRGWATLPDGTKRWLLYIPDWDFNWQDAFRFVEPVPLPRGTVLGVEMVFDNSADNVRNPNNPPQRVVYGPSTFDEMADLWFQVLTRTRDEREALKAHFTRKENLDRIGLSRRRLEREPEDARTHLELGWRLLDAGQADEGMEHLREVIRLDPGEPLAYYNLAVGFMRKGQAEQGEYYFRRAIELAPGDLDARLGLARVYLQGGRVPEALETARAAVAVAPEDPQARFTLGRVLQTGGDAAGALAEFREVLRLEPDSIVALDGAARILATHPDPSIRDPGAALRHAERAAGLSARKQPMVLATLAAAQASAGRVDEAAATIEEALGLAAGPGAEGLAQGLRRQLEMYRRGIAPGAGPPQR